MKIGGRGCLLRECMYRDVSILQQSLKYQGKRRKNCSLKISNLFAYFFNNKDHRSSALLYQIELAELAISRKEAISYDNYRKAEFSKKFVKKFWN